MRHRLKVKQSADGEWVATCGSLPGVVSRGPTRPKAVQGIAQRIQELPERTGWDSDRWVLDPNHPPARFWIWLHVSALTIPFALLCLLRMSAIPTSEDRFLVASLALPMLFCPLMVLWSVVNRRQSFLHSLLALAAETLIFIVQGTFLVFPAIQ